MHLWQLVLLHPGALTCCDAQLIVHMLAQCAADLPSQMSSSTWPDSPRQLAEQSLTPLKVSPLPPPHPNPFTNIPAGFSSASRSSGLQKQDPQPSSVGSLAGPHRLASNPHSLASDPKVLGSDFNLLGSGPVGVVPNPDTPSLEFHGAVPGSALCQQTAVCHR